MDRNISDLIDNIRKAIREIRNGNYNNLQLLIRSLENLEDLNIPSFETWDGAIGAKLGKGTCREIGKEVCKQEHFTIKEGMLLLEVYRHSEAIGLDLEEDASWQKIHTEEMRRINKKMCDDAI